MLCFKSNILPSVFPTNSARAIQPPALQSALSVAIHFLRLTRVLRLVVLLWKAIAPEIYLASK